MTKVATRWDSAEYLCTDEEIAAYLSAVLEENDPKLFNVALGNIARAKGMTQIARETGISRDGLYKAFSPQGNPAFSTVQKVLDALGFALDSRIKSAS